MDDDPISQSLDDGWAFSFRSGGNQIIPSGKDAEEYLHSLLAARTRECQRVRLELLRFYRSAARAADALAIAREYLAQGVSNDEKSEAYFHLGQTMEGVRDWESAIRWYRLARASGTSSQTYLYFIHNNIGFSLNQLGRYRESADELQSAMVIDPSRANAFKNYGLCLEGQGRFAEAAHMYIDGIRADAADPRALTHLEDLMRRHGEIRAQIPELDEEVVRCKAAIAFAVEARRNTKQE